MVDLIAVLDRHIARHLVMIRQGMAVVGFFLNLGFMVSTITSQVNNFTTDQRHLVHQATTKQPINQ